MVEPPRHGSRGSVPVKRRSSIVKIDGDMLAAVSAAGGRDSLVGQRRSSVTKVPPLGGLARRGSMSNADMAAAPNMARRSSMSKAPSDVPAAGRRGSVQHGSSPQSFTQKSHAPLVVGPSASEHANSISERLACGDDSEDRSDIEQQLLAIAGAPTDSSYSLFKRSNPELMAEMERDMLLAEQQLADEAAGIIRRRPSVVVRAHALPPPPPPAVLARATAPPPTDRYTPVGLGGEALHAIEMVEGGASLDAVFSDLEHRSPINMRPAKEPMSQPTPPPLHPSPPHARTPPPAGDDPEVCLVGGGVVPGPGAPTHMNLAAGTVSSAHCDPCDAAFFITLTSPFAPAQWMQHWMTRRWRWRRRRRRMSTCLSLAMTPMVAG